ncbi:TRAP transporter substrate-binding protein DctP [Sporanaerobium hydrogeniformans]|uniref:TRAP transporter substrate-binding protein DctP n=1 Tax=Sporanaerobium hydrogeniformans TaxID=3072179 RepID=A0AC61DAF8_9FIRM|nr:TRAP transporter substrate-binding protein [Sporanaerobium hydrogeniformans]PHV70002.1 TRAP transporter substrate-binding protein DctP [Sporanaerobium hydrogeniformans]
MNSFIKKGMALLLTVPMVFALSGCNLANNGKRIIRISHSQSEAHPDHVGLLAFEEYVESKLGDKYDVQIFPNELLGSSVKAIELVQTGAIDFAIASTSNLETFDDIYQIFTMPYLFNSVEAYHAVMENEELISGIFSSTAESGFEAVAWFEAGTRNFYATSPIKTVEDLKGKKIRVQQSPANVRMMELFGAAATPMSFGEVYTAIQSGVINGAENNELALTNNKHGEICKYYTYNQHQMVPDLLIGNLRFLEGLSPEERQIFDEAAKIATQVEREEWDEQVAVAKEQATEMGVQFFETDIEPFREKVLPLHQELLAANPKLQPIYDHIQAINNQVQEAK